MSYFPIRMIVISVIQPISKSLILSRPKLKKENKLKDITYFI